MQISISNNTWISFWLRFPRESVSSEELQCPYPPNKFRTKPKASKQLKRQFHSKLSNALWKSINIIKPGIFSFRENSIKSKIDRTVSPIKRSFRKPPWLWWIILGRTFFILVAKTLEIILASTLTSEIGLKFSKKERSFPFLEGNWGNVSLVAVVGSRKGLYFKPLKLKKLLLLKKIK